MVIDASEIRDIQERIATEMGCSISVSTLQDRVLYASSAQVLATVVNTLVAETGADEDKVRHALISESARARPNEPRRVRRSERPAPGNLMWSGYEWTPRSGEGNPSSNTWEPGNVLVDADGHLHLRITNTDGVLRSSQVRSVHQGWGFGTYECVVAGRVDLLHPNAVLGGLYTFDSANPPGYTEIDMCEASSWGGTGAVRMQHGYWHDATLPAGEGNVAETFTYPSDPVTSHRTVWSPGQLVMESFSGGSFSGALLKRTVLTGDLVPVPSAEILNFNLWVFKGQGDWESVPDTEVIVRSFRFAPGGE